MKLITLRNFNSALKTIGSQSATMAVIAGYVLEQAHIHKNLDAASRAFNAPVFIDQRNGQLNALGSQLKNYIVAHSRYIQIGVNKDTKQPTFKLRDKVTGQETHCLVDVAASRKAGERVFQAEPVSDIGAVLLDFKQFVEYSAATKPAVQPLTVKQLNDRIGNISKALSERGIKALPAELEESLTALNELQAAILKAVAGAECDAVETSALEQVSSVKPSSKSKAASKVV